MTSKRETSTETNDRERKTFAHLRAALDLTDPLLERLNVCGEELGTFPYRYTKFCNQPPCPRCRRRYRGKQAKRLNEWFRDQPPEGMALMTVVLKPCVEVGEVFSAFDTARQAIRNLSKRRGWSGIQICGWLETDAVADEDMPLLGQDRRNLLADLGHTPPNDGSPLWWPSIHGIVALGGLAHQEFHLGLSSLWDAKRQVDVSPFYVDTPVDVSVINIVDYCVKHRCSRSLLGLEAPWPPNWLAEYYSSLYSHKKGFRGSSFNMGLMRKNEKDNDSLEDECLDDLEE